MRASFIDDSPALKRQRNYWLGGSGPGGGPVDPFFASVILLLHATTFADSSLNNRTPTVSGNAAISTAQFVSDPSSVALDGTGDYVTYAGTTATPADFTLEMCFRWAANTGSDQSILCLPASNWNIWRINATSRIQLYQAGGLRIDGGAASASALNTWFYLVWQRSAGVMTLGHGVPGGTISQIGANYNDAAAYELGAPRFGTSSGVSFFANGFYDEVRFTGAARYTYPFACPDFPFPDQGP